MPLETLRAKAALLTSPLARQAGVMAGTYQFLLVTEPQLEERWR